MQTITFTCETITPMFLSGADGSTPELRPPSIKGALRFWWRAMNGHLVELKKDKNGQDYWDYSKLKEQEALIFGGTEPAQRSRVIVRTRNNPKLGSNNSVLSFPNHNSYNIQTGDHTISIFNFLSYGVKEKNRERGFIQSLKEFSFEITLPDELETEILQAIYLFSYFGGLGSKSRNGFGSFSVKNKLVEKSLKEYNARISKFTSLSNQTQLFIGKEHKNAYDALAEIGKSYHYAKSQVTPSRNKGYISLPLRGSTVQGVERHTKPYFLSIHKTENSLYQGKILFLPYEYLSDYQFDNGRKMPQSEIQQHQQNYNSITKKFCEDLVSNRNQNRLTETTL